MDVQKRLADQYWKQLCYIPHQNSYTFYGLLNKLEHPWTSPDLEHHLSNLKDFFQNPVTVRNPVAI